MKITHNSSSKSSPALIVSLGLTLIELLVAIGIIGVLIALVVPAVQAARESARRTQCANNLKQLTLAAQGYHQLVGQLPMGGYYPASTLINSNSGPYTFALLPHLELSSLHNAINFDVSPFYSMNSTILGVELAVFLCPSDVEASREARLSNLLYDDLKSVVSTRFCSYAGNCGTWFCFPFANDPTRSRQLASMNGVVYQKSAVRFTDIKDGTSHTFLFGEQAHGMGEPTRRDRWHWWSSSIGTQFTTMWPMNPRRAVPELVGPAIPVGGTVYLISASSFHPGAGPAHTNLSLP
jgi:prepilin-type N-terminal cleavage/methylation domain-containing protein